MLLLHLGISAGLLLSFPQCTTGVCTEGTPKQCQEADFVPGSNLAGGKIQSVTSIRQCQASLQGLSAEEVQMCLEVEASASFRVTLLPANTTTWFNLRSAISHYILEKGLVINCTERCRKDSRDHCVCQCHNDPAVNSDCCPTRKGMARVILTVQRATGLWGDYFTSTDGFVKVFYHKAEVRRSPVINNNNNPHWGMVVDLGSQDLSASKLRIEVWDQDNGWDDDQLGACEPVLANGIKEDVCNLNHGRLYFKWEVKCAPSLSGNLCTEYVQTPMNPSLKKLYVSRHAHPIPKPMLLEMGVFVNKSASSKLAFWRNQTLTAKMQTYDFK
ncbi:hypothetical protein GOODEAATRI_015533 [Goodea atripinnis]|uniref:C2 domain-containing protein n=1 Tax=Goodea atripinnis TaxID=208336 RepID=A0ABV0N1R5_9TELE